MKNVAKHTGNTFTHVHMLQRYNGGYRIRTGCATLKRFTSVEVKPEHRHLFGEDGEGIYHSEIFNTIPEGAHALCKFIEKVCGVPCEWKP
ncbi:hypothetical protein [Leclercia tamurae]|uniref:hypothetical protein n=1 Tax=Leclercia tamurae TaxID=2926467 RepID=UPI0036F48F2B